MVPMNTPTNLQNKHTHVRFAKWGGITVQGLISGLPFKTVFCEEQSHPLSLTPTPVDGGAWQGIKKAEPPTGRGTYN